MTTYPTPPGWKLVPVVPTEEMSERAAREYEALMLLKKECTFFDLWQEALTAAPEPPAMAVKVKELVWVEAGGGLYTVAGTPFGRYQAYRCNDFARSKIYRIYLEKDCIGGKYVTLEAAQAAAQADYESRIREAIEVGDDEG